MKELGDTLGVPLHVFGPETHMTAVVAMALGQRASTSSSSSKTRASTTANFLLATSSTSVLGAGSTTPQTPQSRSRAGTDQEERKAVPEKDLLKTAVSKAKSLFTKDTQAIIWGLQNRAVQGMLDFDFVCRRSKPSVVASVYPFV